MKKVLLVALAMLMLVSILVACDDTDGLAGTWESSRSKVFRHVSHDFPNEEEYFETIVFSGNSYTATVYEYRKTSTQIKERPQTGASPAPAPAPPRVETDGLSGFVSEQERTNARVVYSFSSESEYYLDVEEIVQITTKGTFSTSNDTIEFVTSDNRVLTAKFETTENTLRIGAMHFIRSGRSR
jgi:hypothetical protein